MNSQESQRKFRKHFKVKVFTLFVGALFMLQASCTSGDRKTTKHILFIGNSYTYRNSMPALFKGIARSKGEELEVKHVTRGKYTFYHHAKRKAVEKALKYHKWDYIILQGSSRDLLRDSLRMHKRTFPAIEKLLADFRVLQPKAKVFFYMTWPYQNGYKLDERYASDSSMLAGIEAGYAELKQKYRIPVIPVGEIWFHYKRTYPEHNLYTRDHSHPSFDGSYLVACVMYQSLFNKSPMGAQKHRLYNKQRSRNIQVFVQKQFYQPDVQNWLKRFD